MIGATCLRRMDFGFNPEWGAGKLVKVTDLPWPARDNQIKWLTKSGDVVVVFGFGSVLPRIHPDTKNTCPYWLGSQAR